MRIIRFIISKIFAIQLLILVVLTYLAYLFIFKGIDSYTRHNESVMVPNVENMQLDEVGMFLDSLELRYRVIDSSEYNLNFDRGAVTEVYPIVGNLVKPDRELLLTVNPIIPEQVIVPNVIDKSKRQAMDKLRFAGINIGTLTYVPDMAKDVVLSMRIGEDEITPGSKVEKLATLDLVLGNGLSNERILMPYVVGLSFEEASYKLKSFSLNTGAINYDRSTVGEDSTQAKVYKQRPYASTSPIIRMGADVDLWLTMDSTKVKIDTLFSQLQ